MSRLFSSVAHIGYFCLAIAAIQVMSLFLIVILQHTVFNLPSEQVMENSVIRRVWHDVAPIPVSPSDRLWLPDVIAWLLLPIVVILLILYTGKVGSKLLKWSIKKCFGKVTIGSLFTTKFTLIGALFMLQTLFSLLLPPIEIIMPLNLLIGIVAYTCFGIQFYLVRRNKISIKNVL